jgi:riboflavin kinase / FMN adenylyltransferase
VKIIRNIEEIPVLKNPVVTIGSFDGVHKGHRAIILRTTEIAKEINGVSVVVTFFPHPQLVLHPNEKNLFILNTLEEKTVLLSSLGIDYLVVIPFTKEFANIPYNQFIKQFLAEKIHAKAMVIGYDHHFGNNREGSIKHLHQLAAEYLFDVIEVPAQNIQQVAVSSTKIRKALFAGDIRTANQYLGYSYLFTGTVVKGEGLGRKLGFPTANLEPEDKAKLIPGDGVYAVIVEIDGTNYSGMLNIGFRPTVGGKSRVIEVNIFDFSSDIYNKKTKINFAAKLRNEIKFAETGELIKQLSDDKIDALKILSGKMS